MAQHNELGKRGEELAVALLQRKGYTILERNYHFQKAEVDVIARKDGLLIAVEVKARSSTDFGNPQDFIKKRKIARLVSAVDHYVVSRDLDVEVRFDIIAVVKKGEDFEVEHLEGAFYHF